MATTNALPPPQDLTGKVLLVDLLPEFRGNYSEVYRGSLNGDYVAIKSIKVTGKEESMPRRILREITLWASTSHPNIHAFYGFTHGELFGPFGALISPWCANGDAARYLKEKGQYMTPNGRFYLWRGVMEGVAYLHEHNPIIVHGDLKPGNVLIDDHGVPRICDFGLARVFQEAGGTGLTTTSEHMGTTRYLPPELVTTGGNVYPTTQSDVYALGCLGLRFMYNQEPYADRLVDWRILLGIKGGVPPAAGVLNGDNASQKRWNLIQNLWDRDPRNRPSASEAVSQVYHVAFSPQPIIIRVIAEPILIKMIIEFSALVSGKDGWADEWIQRTRSLLALSLVAKPFLLHTTPHLYRDIRITPSTTKARVSSLMTTLISGKANPCSSDDSPSGYGPYTRTLLFCVDSSAFRIPDHLQALLGKMTKLHTLLIRTTEFFWNAIPHHSLRSVEFLGVSLLLIPDRRTLSMLVPFQRLYAGLVGGLSVPESPLSELSYLGHWATYFGPDSSREPKPPLPNLQNITLGDDGFRGTSASPLMLVPFKDWITPCLNSLECTLYWDHQLLDTHFLNFIQAHGSILRYLTLNGEVGSHAPPISDILPLCSNLRSLVIISYSYVDLLSFPRHRKLKTLDIRDAGADHSDTEQEPYSGQCDIFTFSWQKWFPNLRVAQFWVPEFNISLQSEASWLEIHFCTENSFFTVKHDEMTYKRWEGKWIGAALPSTIWAGLSDSDDDEIFGWNTECGVDSGDDDDEGTDGSLES